MSLRDEVWSVARNIGLEKSELTLRELNTMQVPPCVLPSHLELVGAWVEAVECLRWAREAS